MQVLTKIFLWLWTTWCIAVFVTLCTILFPILLFAVLTGSNPLIRAAHFAPTRLARVALFLWGVRLEIVNPEMIDPNGQYIYISNHRSLLDAVVAGAVIPNYLKFLGKAEMLQWPVLGYLLNKFYVPVQRQDKDDRARSMTLMEEKINTGCSFYICPESSCNTTDELLTRFYNGAFRLSAHTDVALVPLTFIGSALRWPRNEIRIHPGKLIVYWHEPMPAAEFKGDNLNKGREKAAAIIRTNLLKHYPSGNYAAKS